MGKTKFCDEWIKEWGWLKRTQEPYTAYCKLCKKSFRIDGAGIAQVKIHSKGVKHREVEKIISGRSNQARFISLNAMGNTNEEMTLGRRTIILTDKELTNRAEIIQALKVVDSNWSFSSAADDSERYQKMFPDSEIAKCYKQGSSKVRYIIQYGIAPYFQKLLEDEVSDSPFTFKFDETTTSQVKKQYDGHIQFWSEKENRIVNNYCGSLFVGHCTSEDLLLHFNEFGQKMKWNVGYLLHIGMDGPNVNKAFENKLSTELVQKHNTKFLKLGTCSLHHVHNAFRKGLQKLDFNFDEFAYDIHFFFQIFKCQTRRLYWFGKCH